MNHLIRLIIVVYCRTLDLYPRAFQDDFAEMDAVFRDASSVWSIRALLPWSDRLKDDLPKGAIRLGRRKPPERREMTVFLLEHG